MAWDKQYGAGYNLYADNGPDLGDPRDQGQQFVGEFEGEYPWSGKELTKITIGDEEEEPAAPLFHTDPYAFLYRDEGTENIAQQLFGDNQRANQTLGGKAQYANTLGADAQAAMAIQQGRSATSADNAESLSQQYVGRTGGVGDAVGSYAAPYNPYSGAVTQDAALYNLAGLTGEDQRVADYAAALAGQQYNGANSGQYDALQALQGMQAPDYSAANQDLLAAGRAGVQLQLAALNDSAGLGRAASAINQWNPARAADQLQSAMDLENWANQGPGPSAAEAQLRQGLDRTVAAQMALARSGRVGESGAAMRQAQATAAGAMQNTNAELANLRAQEAAQWRGQQQQAYSTALQARQGIANQQLDALVQAGQLRQALGTQQLQGLSSAAEVLARTGATRADVQSAGADMALRQAMGQADVANTIGAQDLQGLGLNQAANAQAADILSREIGRQGDLTATQAGLGAQYSQTGADIAGQAAALNLQGMSQDDAMRQYWASQGYNYDTLGQQAALAGQELQQGYYTAGLQGALDVNQQNLAAQQNLVTLLQARDDAALQAAMQRQNLEMDAAVQRERMAGDWYYGVQSQEAALQSARESALIGAGGTILGAGIGFLAGGPAGAVAGGAAGNAAANELTDDDDRYGI